MLAAVSLTEFMVFQLIQPKSDFDLSDPRGFLINSEYNCLHDPNLRGYLYRKDIHQRLLRGGFITKNDKVSLQLTTMHGVPHCFTNMFG